MWPLINSAICHQLWFANRLVTYFSHDRLFDISGGPRSLLSKRVYSTKLNARHFENQILDIRLYLRIKTLIDIDYTVAALSSFRPQYLPWIQKVCKLHRESEVIFYRRTQCYRTMIGSNNREEFTLVSAEITVFLEHSSSGAIGNMIAAKWTDSKITSSRNDCGVLWWEHILKNFLKTSPLLNTFQHIRWILC